LESIQSHSPGQQNAYTERTGTPKIVYDVHPTAIDEAKDGVRGRGVA